jgi:hypothetical protein
MLLHFLCEERKGDLVPMREVLMPRTKGGRVTALFCVLIGSVAFVFALISFPSKTDKEMGFSYYLICLIFGLGSFVASMYFVYTRSVKQDGKYFLLAAPATTEESKGMIGFMGLAVTSLAMISWLVKFIVSRIT